MFAAGLLTIAKLRNQPRCPSAGNEEENRVYIHNWGFSIKKNEVVLFTRKCMQLEIVNAGCRRNHRESIGASSPSELTA